MTLQEHIDTVQAGRSVVPVVKLGRLEEITQAMVLRRDGLTYRAIANVMRLYHGSTRTEDGWRGVLRRAGAAPKHYGASYGRRLAPHERERVSS